MAAGLPGIGLSGLFTLLTALLMPVIEAGRWMTGHGPRRRWRDVWRQWFTALAMVGAYAAMALLSWDVLHHDGPSPSGTWQWLTSGGVFAISLAILSALVCGLAFLGWVNSRSHVPASDRP